MIHYHEADTIKLIHSGKNYFDTLEQIILESKSILHFQTYIFVGDDTGKRIIQLLKEAAHRGVNVYLLPDAFGSFSFPKHLAREMKSAGIHFRLFSPTFSTESILPWRRLHHKIVVADNNKALIGGINIANKYNSLPDSPAWLDYAVLAEGSVCSYLSDLCESIYFKKKFSPLTNATSVANPDLKNNSKDLIRFRRNDWFKNKNEIHKSYIEALKQAQSSITIVASYFLPGANFRRLLREASQRGVKIKIIMAGKSDSYSVKLAEYYLYDFYIRYNIELYEWKESVLHGKVMQIDHKWATIGSYNLNFLSHYISIELNADIIAADFNGQLSKHFSLITHDYSSTFKLNPSKYRKNIFVKFLMWLTYNFFRLMMTIFVSARKKHKRK